MPLPINTTQTSYYLKEQLTRTVNRIYDVNYSQMWGLDASQNLHTAIGDLPLGLEYFSVWVKEHLGEIPAIYDGQGDDIPTVDVQIGKKDYKAVIFALASEWNLMQIEKERVASQINTLIPSLNLVTTKQEAVGDFFNRGEHFTVLYGYPKVGVRGIFSQSGIALEDATFAPYVKSAGAYTLSTAALYEDLIDIIWNFVNIAKISSPQDVEMVVPPALGRRLVEVYKTTAGESVGMTISQMLRSTELGLGVRSITTRKELQGSNLNKYVLNDAGSANLPTNRDRIVFKVTGRSAERHFFARRPFNPFQRSTLDFEQVTVSATTGLISPYIDEIMWYYDFSNATA